MEGTLLWLGHTAHLGENELPIMQVLDGFDPRGRSQGHIKQCLLVQGSLMLRDHLGDWKGSEKSPKGLCTTNITSISALSCSLIPFSGIHPKLALVEV